MSQLRWFEEVFQVLGKTQIHQYMMEGLYFPSGPQEELKDAAVERDV